MFLLARVFSFEKNKSEDFKHKALQKSVVQDAQGFIKKEVLFENGKEFDVVRVHLYFESEEVFQTWHKGPEHAKMHREGHHQKPEGLIKMHVEKYQILL